MLNLRPLDERVPIQQQLNDATKPAILINIFTVAPADVDHLLAAWEHDANWMKKQPGYISTQLHRGIGSSCVFLNYAVWESVGHFREAFTHPEFQNALAAYPSSVVALQRSAFPIFAQARRLDASQRAIEIGCGKRKFVGLWR